MSDPDVRLHDVSISGNVDRAAILAAIEQAVARAASSGTPTTEAMRTAIATSVAKANRT